MNLDLLSTFVERLRAESIGEPRWVESKQVFEFQEQTVEVAVVLKLVRAAQGVHALTLLCQNGLFVDMGAIYRCVEDCVSETYFLLERYPKRSSGVEKFLAHFFSKTIDGYLSSEEQPVSTKKIHNAMVRSLTESDQDEHTKELITNVYKTFSGYTHAGYSHIMQMFGGTKPNLHFNISGVPSRQQRAMHMELVSEAYKSVLCAIAYAAQTLGLEQLRSDVVQAC